jgi:hypothetical protein
MKIVEKICKEWNSICRVFNIKENPLTYSHKDLLEFAEYYHNSQLNNNEVLDIVVNSKITEVYLTHITTCSNQSFYELVKAESVEHAREILIKEYGKEYTYEVDKPLE